MELIKTIQERPQEFLAICKKHNVESIFGFGSAITSDFEKASSDIDIIVELNIADPIEYGETLLNLWSELEIYFDRKVDLLTETSIRNPYLRKNIDQTKKLIYDRQREKVFV